MKFRRMGAILLLIILIFIISRMFQNSTSLVGRFLGRNDIIVIDPGHGGKDPGTVGINRVYEKDINLQIAKKLYKKLKAMNYRVVLTRASDEYIDNSERAILANNKKAKMFVSIHCNALENNNSVNGAQVLYYPNRESTINDLDNEYLAQMVLDEMVSTTEVGNKGIVPRDDLIVLNQTEMLAILIECGFLSNEREANLLSTEEYQDKMVEAIAKGIETYFNYQ